jgi:hypothetical protein
MSKGATEAAVAEAVVIVNGFPIAAPVIGIDRVPLIDATTAGILANVNNFKIKQRTSLLEAATQGWIEMSNSYDVFDAANGVHLFTVLEQRCANPHNATSSIRQHCGGALSCAWCAPHSLHAVLPVSAAAARPTIPSSSSSRAWRAWVTCPAPSGVILPWRPRSCGLSERVAAPSGAWDAACAVIAAPTKCTFMLGRCGDEPHRCRVPSSQPGTKLMVRATAHTCTHHERGRG